MRRQRHWRLAVALLLLVVTTACGRKTDPIIPESPRPEEVGDLKAVARADTAWLTWSIPARNVEGKSMNPADIVQFRIYRAEFARDAKTGRYKPYDEIDAAHPAPATIRDNRVTWHDGNLKYGTTYGYRIRAVSARGGLSGLSPEARVTPVIPLAVPQDVTARAGDNSITLSWTPVKTWLDNSPATGFMGYNIYRGTEPGRRDPTPLNREPVTDTSFKDRTAVNNHTYFYVVRSVAEPERPWTESPDSAEASATPRDQTPPARPSGLTVVAGLRRVFLTWNENKERDLAGYNVYRSSTNGKGFRKLNDKLLTRTTFSDDSVTSGATYYYTVTAVDVSGNESARTDEKKAHVEKIPPTGENRR